MQPATPGRSGYDLAKSEWQLTQAETAFLNSATWTQAASYLAMGEGVDPGNTSGYPAAIGELNQLASFPEMVTPSQVPEELADIHGLNAFFGTHFGSNG